jgi:hypothetical protein
MSCKQINYLIATEGYTEECQDCVFFSSDIEFGDAGDCTCLRDELCMRVEDEKL